MAVKDLYSKILLNFNDSISYDECNENIWKESGSISLEKNLFSYPVAFFNGDGNISLNSNEISIDSPLITFEFWIYLIEGHFGFSSFESRNDTVCLCIGSEGIGFNTGISSYYPGYYIVAGNTGSNLLSLNTWHFITLSIKDNTHFISIDGIIQYSGINSRNYPLKFLPTQIGSVPTWNYGKSNPFPFKGYIKGFRISSGIARYTDDFTCPIFPNSPGQNTAINISIPNSGKQGSYKAKNMVTYFYNILFSKVSNSEAIIRTFYRKNSNDIKYSQTSVVFTFDNFMNSKAILLSKANEEINNLKKYLDKIIDEIILPQESILNYTSDITGIDFSVRQKYSSIDNSIYSCRIILDTFYSKTSNPNKEFSFSRKIISVNSDNYFQINSLMIDLSEEELTSCKIFLDTLINSNILLPNTKYKNIKALNGNTFYLRLSYSLESISDTHASINYKVTWGNTAEFKFTFSNKSFSVDSDIYLNYYSILTRLGENELNKCIQMFDNISNNKIMIKTNDSIKNIITYFKSNSFGNYLGILRNKNEERIFCKLLEVNEEEKNKITSRNNSLLVIRKNNKLFYINQDF